MKSKEKKIEFNGQVLVCAWVMQTLATSCLPPVGHSLL